jgi:hypothetical protein
VDSLEITTSTEKNVEPFTDITANFQELKKERVPVPALLS